MTYSEANPNCTAPCIRSVDLFWLDLPTQTASRLTDIGRQLLNEVSAETLQYYSVCSPGRLNWSPSNRRVYYAITCFDGGDQPHSYLYSTDLMGDHRLEVDLPSLYPEDLYTVIVGTHVTEDTIYFVVESETRPQSGALEFTSWLIFPVGLHICEQ